MKIIFRNEIYRVSNDHPYVPAILGLARTAPFGTDGVAAPPERNDLKRLWSELSASHKRFLHVLSQRPTGISQRELEKVLDVDWQGLRGIHNGIARICQRLDCEKPVSVSGYNSSNRVYQMLQDAAATVRTLHDREGG